MGALNATGEMAIVQAIFNFVNLIKSIEFNLKEIIYFDFNYETTPTWNTDHTEILFSFLMNLCSSYFI